MPFVIRARRAHFAPPIAPALVGTALVRPIRARRARIARRIVDHVAAMALVIRARRVHRARPIAVLALFAATKSARAARRAPNAKAIVPAPAAMVFAGWASLAAIAPSIAALVAAIRFVRPARRV